MNVFNFICTLLLKNYPYFLCRFSARKGGGGQVAWVAFPGQWGCRSRMTSQVQQLQLLVFVAPQVKYKAEVVNCENCTQFAGRRVQNQSRYLLNLSSGRSHDPRQRFPYCQNVTSAVDTPFKCESGPLASLFPSDDATNATVANVSTAPPCLSKF